MAPIIRTRLDATRSFLYLAPLQPPDDKIETDYLGLSLRARAAKNSEDRTASGVPWGGIGSHSVGVIVFEREPARRPV